MKTISRRMSTNPLTLWGNLALQTTEMLLASVQVIGHRTSRMASAGLLPSARDRREFSLMGQEKIDAASESVQAMTAHMLSIHQQMAARAMSGMLASAADAFALATSMTAGQALARQAKLVKTLTRGAASATTLTNAAARVAHRGLKPIHARATANAKRLAKP